MRSFIREKKIYCGNQYREVDIFSYTDTQKTASRRGKRSKKVRESEPKQKNLNDKNARRYLIQLGNLNFAGDDEAFHVTLTYSKKNLPQSIEAAEKEAGNYLRRIQYRREKEGLEPIKYILVHSYHTGKDGEKPTRIHHHIIMNGGLDRELVEAMWTKTRVNWKKWKADAAYRRQICKGRIGYINADRLQTDENGIAALCSYLAKQPNGKKRWCSSQNLDKPYSRTNDGRYNHRQIEKIARERPGREFWEKKYPGWTLTDEDYGVTYEYNDFTGWSIYLKLRKKE